MIWQTWAIAVIVAAYLVFRWFIAAPLARFIWRRKHKVKAYKRTPEEQLDTLWRRK